MSKWDKISFEGKHIDEKVLHYCRPSKYQTFYEILKIEIPVLLISIIFILVSLYEILSFSITLPIIALLWVVSSLTVAYKIYRSKNNYLFITSKRILFH
jgi:membrane protein YdbS with pleckstrin-like domain